MQNAAIIVGVVKQANVLQMLPHINQLSHLAIQISFQGEHFLWSGCHRYSEGMLDPGFASEFKIKFMIVYYQFYFFWKTIEKSTIELIKWLK